MLDIKLIRKNPREIQDICDARGASVDIPQLLAVDDRKLELQKELEQLRANSNSIASKMKGATPDEREDIKLKGAKLKKEIKILEELVAGLNEQYEMLVKSVPNILAEDTPRGSEDNDNVEIEVFGVKPRYDFTPKDHIELGKKFGMDFEAGTRVAGSGFPLLKGEMALLENAIMRFTQDQAIKAGFIPNNVPLLVKLNILEGLGFNPRRDDDGTEVFSTMQDDLCLAGTAEISLVGQYTDLMLDTSELPIKLVAYTPCFRREGSYGRRDAGLYRNKMFNKVELVVLTDTSSSDKTLETIKEFEIMIFKQLDIYFRVVRICAGDLGAPAYKKYDIEGWMMGRGESDGASGWGELTSCSNCTDYQARRLNIRHRSSNKDKPEFVHTLNGTGITSRAMITILEQFQNEDGSVIIPEVLRPYMNDMEELA